MNNATGNQKVNRLDGRKKHLLNKAIEENLAELDRYRMTDAEASVFLSEKTGFEVNHFHVMSARNDMGITWAKRRGPNAMGAKGKSKDRLKYVARDLGKIATVVLDLVSKVDTLYKRLGEKESNSPSEDFLRNLISDLISEQTRTIARTNKPVTLPEDNEVIPSVTNGQLF